MAIKNKRNSIVISDVPAKLYAQVKTASKSNVRTMGNEALVALKDKFKFKD